MPHKGFSQTKTFDPDAVREEYGGLGPDQIVEYKALRGDSSDNIPGVKGIGEKSAIALLLQYPTIDLLYKNIDEVEQKFAKKLIEGKELAYVSQELATIVTTVPLPVSLDETSFETYDAVKLRTIFTRHDFNSLIKKVIGEPEPVHTLFDIASLPDKETNSSNFDVKIAAHLLTGASGKGTSLDSLALEILGHHIAPEDALSQDERNAVTSALQTELEARFELLENNMLKVLFEEVEMPLKKVLLTMEKCGICVDRGLLRTMTEEYASKLLGIEKQIYDAIGHEVNINSPKQLQEVLFDELHLPVVKRTKTQRSTDESVLEKLKLVHPVVSLLLEYRQIHKIASTYLYPLPDYLDQNDRVHTTFNQTKTASGRLSSENPNLQNIPTDLDLGVRKLFVPQEGSSLIVADYSQIELRILAHITKDEQLKESFVNGQDIHTTTAAKIFNVEFDDVSVDQRKVGKTINFGLLYGMGSYSLAEQLGIELSEAKRYISAFFDSYPHVVEWKEKHLANARERGYVETMYGRRRYLPALSARNNIQKSGAERIAVNHPIQGTQADIIKMAMNRLAEVLPDDSHMLIQVHDELVFEVPDKQVNAMMHDIKKQMESIVSLDVPIDVDVNSGSNWQDAK